MQNHAYQLVDKASQPGVPRRHLVCQQRSARQKGVQVPAERGHRQRADQRHKSGQHRGMRLRTADAYT